MSADFVGRKDALGVIADAIESARGGTPVIVSIEGPPGIGKSALVAQATVGLGSDVVRVALCADEFARDVRLVALRGLVTTASTTSGFEVGLELLDRFAEMSADHTLVLTVEDLHWADLASRQALATVARRLDHEAVVMITTARPEHTGVEDGWARIRLDAARCVRIPVVGLSAAEVGVLAVSRGVALPGAAVERLVGHTGGNPLYVGVLLSELAPAVLAGPIDDLPVPRTLSATITAAIANLPPDTVQLLSALAVLDGPAPLFMLAAVAGVDGPASAVDAAVTSGYAQLGSVDGRPTYGFAHPLFRSVVAAELSSGRRRELHAAAALVTDHLSALRHRVAAAARPEPALADELQDEAERVLADDPQLAAQLLRWSADLTVALDGRERRMLIAARWLLANDDPMADQLRADVARCRPSALASLLGGQYAYRAGELGQAEVLLTQAADSGEPDVAAEALVRLADLHVGQARGPEAEDAAARALASGSLHGQLERQAWAYRSLGRASVVGPLPALELLAERIPFSARRTSPADLPLVSVRGMLSVIAGRPQEAIEDLEALAHRGGAAHGLRSLRRSHVDLAQCLFTVGRWDQAALHARVAVDLTERDPSNRAAGLELLVAIYAARGQSDQARAAADEVVAIHRRFTSPGTWVASLQSRLAIAAASDDAATIVSLVEWPRPTPPMLSTLSLYHPLGAALIATGQGDVAASVIETYEQEATRRRLDVALELADLRARLAAQRGDPAAAADQFNTGLTAVNANRDVLRVAGMRLAFGRLLHNVGRRHDSLEQLGLARAQLEALGATPYVDRVDAELAGIGFSGSRRRGSLELTDREQDVATLVVRGLTNKQTAAQMYVSVKAVEYHLRNVYGKLGINSRVELRHRLAAAS
jgi:DNA-binding CsgD family transcriptional regulator/tetratricopeptide (TPR) repeat protein